MVDIKFQWLNYKRKLYGMQGKAWLWPPSSQSQRRWLSQKAKNASGHAVTSQTCCSIAIIPHISCRIFAFYPQPDNRQELP